MVSRSVVFPAPERSEDCGASVLKVTSTPSVNAEDAEIIVGLQVSFIDPLLHEQFRSATRAESDDDAHHEKTIGSCIVASWYRRRKFQRKRCCSSRNISRPSIVAQIRQRHGRTPGRFQQRCHAKQRWKRDVKKKSMVTGAGVRRSAQTLIDALKSNAAETNKAAEKTSRGGPGRRAPVNTRQCRNAGLGNVDRARVQTFSEDTIRRHSGNTSGKVTTVSTKSFPGQRYESSNQAVANPTGRISNCAKRADGQR